MKPAARLITAAALALAALAPARAARAADAPAFADLPAGRFSSAPPRRPARVRAGERAPGLYASSRQAAARMAQDARVVMVVADAALAEAMERGARRAPAEVPASCVSEVSTFLDSTAGGPLGSAGEEWPETLAPEVVAVASRGRASGNVVAVHAERLVEGGATASLEWVDAWVDPSTRGVRLIGRGSLPLKLVRSSAFGVRVYAARDARPDGRRFVQFVVARPLGAAESDHLGPLLALHQEGSMGHSRCAHVRVGLPLDAAVNDSASVNAPVALPALDPAAGRDAGAGGAKAGPAKAPPPPAPAAAREGAKGPSLPPDDPEPPPPPTLPPSIERELRVRDLNVELGVSQTARDKAPLLSVSFGWAGRERTRRVAMPIE